MNNKSNYKALMIIMIYGMTNDIQLQSNLKNTVKEYFVYIEIAFTIKKLIKKFKIFLTITQKFSTQMKSVVMAIHSKLMKMEK